MRTGVSAPCPPLKIAVTGSDWMLKVLARHLDPMSGQGRRLDHLDKVHT
jgi:hypothetical protein